MSSRRSADLTEAVAHALAQDAFWEDCLDDAERALEAAVPHIAEALRDELTLNGSIGKCVSTAELVRIAKRLMLGGAPDGGA